MNRLHLLLIAFYSLFLTFGSIAQEDKSFKFVPFFFSLRADKLSHHLTNNCTTDEEKIAAIHGWISHNIRFNVGKWLNQEHTRTSIQRILFKRKAVSSGYSDLFNELCKYANIRSITISGYTKNEYTDLKDPLYLNEQEWNAVYINNEWRLVDACWDAGYIVYYKRTFAGYFIYAFTLGASDRLVYKPNFAKAPTTNYFNKSGNYFITDHIAADSIWQLIDPMRSADAFQNDSSYYFHRYDTTRVTEYSDQYNSERMKTFEMTEEERSIVEGFRFFNFNPKNNYKIANSYSIKATNLFKEVNPLMIDKKPLILKCDTIELWLNEAIKHCDSNAVLLLKQKDELAQNNVKKKTIMNSQNKLLISSTNNALKNLNSGIKIGVSSKILTKTMSQRNKILRIKMKRTDKFEKTQAGRKTNITDSTESALEIQKILTDLKQADLAIRTKFTYLENTHSTYLKNLEEYGNRSKQNNEIGKQLCKMRLRFIDDLDYDVRVKKDSLLSHKFKDDSLLIDRMNGPIINHFYEQFASLKDDFSNLYNLNQLLITEYSKYKKANKAKNDCTEQYKAAIELYMTQMKDYTPLLKSYKKKFKQISKLSKSLIDPAQAENHSYKKEQYIELQMVSTRTSFINRHYKSRLSQNKSLKSKCVKLLHKVEKVKMKII